MPHLLVALAAGTRGGQGLCSRGADLAIPVPGVQHLTGYIVSDISCIAHEIYIMILYYIYYIYIFIYMN